MSHASGSLQCATRGTANHICLSQTPSEIANHPSQGGSSKTQLFMDAE
jgi:hypothetical protein